MLALSPGQLESWRAAEGDQRKALYMTSQNLGLVNVILIDKKLSNFFLSIQKSVPVMLQVCQCLDLNLSPNDETCYSAVLL